MANVMKVNSAFEMAPLTPDPWAIVKAIPEGLFNCFTKPWPTEIKNPLFVASFLENLLILVLVGGALAWYKKPNKYSHKAQSEVRVKGQTFRTAQLYIYEGLDLKRHETPQFTPTDQNKFI